MSTLSTEITIVRSFFLCLFLIASLIGNVLVCYAIHKKKKLRTVPNYLVFNLAVADVLFALFGMPMIIATSIAREWTLGHVMCQISGVANTLLCLSSIWTLTIISINRYYAVGKPASYKTLFTKRRVFICIGVIWLLSTITALMPIFGWSKIKDGQSFCTIDGREDKSYAMLVALLAYLAPLLIIIGLYLRIYFILKEHEKVLFRHNRRDSYAANYSIEASSSASEANHNQIVDLSYVSKTDESSSSRGKFSIYRFKNKGSNKLTGHKGEQKSKKSSRTSPMMDKNSEKSSTVGDKTPHNNETSDVAKASTANTSDRSSGEEESDLKVDYTVVRKPIVDRKISQTSNSTIRLRDRIAATLKRKTKSEKKRAFAREARTTRMLFVVVLVFFVCWTPLAIGTILYGLKVETGSFQILNFGITIACLNSACNPIIYAFMSTSFRRAFIDIFESVKSALFCSGSKMSLE